MQARFEQLLASLAQQLAAPEAAPELAEGACVAAGARAVLRLHVGRNKNAGGAATRAFLRVEGVAAPRVLQPIAWFPMRRGWQMDARRERLQPAAFRLAAFRLHLVRLAPAASPALQPPTGLGARTPSHAAAGAPLAAHTPRRAAS